MVNRLQTACVVCYFIFNQTACLQISKFKNGRYHSASNRVLPLANLKEVIGNHQPVCLCFRAAYLLKACWKNLNLTMKVKDYTYVLYCLLILFNMLFQMQVVYTIHFHLLLCLLGCSVFVWLCGGQ